MKLTIIAATGGIGRERPQQALASGHDVTAVVRNPGKLSRDVRTFTTDMSDPDPAALESPPRPSAGRRSAPVRAAGKHVRHLARTTHQGATRLDGDTASGHAYIQELGLFRDGISHLNYAVDDDRCERSGDGWKFVEPSTTSDTSARRRRRAQRPAQRPGLCANHDRPGMED